MYPTVRVYDVLRPESCDTVDGIPEEFRGCEEDGRTNQKHYGHLVVQSEHTAFVYTFFTGQIGLQSRKIFDGRHCARVQAVTHVNTLSQNRPA